MFRLLQASSPEAITAAREIILEYAGTLGVNLCFQNFAAELAALPGDYAPPRGRLFLAEHNGAIAGCGAFRPRSAELAEMKRLYVRPAFRGTGLGRLLATRLIDEARRLGYRSICLDTLPTMHDAQRLYIKLGFVPCAPYYATPVDGTAFMALPLADARSS